MRAVTREEAAWVERQPVFGQPSVTCLRVALTKSELSPLELAMEGDGEGFRFTLLRTAGGTRPGGGPASGYEHYAPGLVLGRLLRGRSRGHDR
jgi:hypothetical protein